ncbi:MAG: sugar phosphate isomerase/epimerase [Defluviitaleaceae bacterium]|nr:sugar phosphate isomerase/epimerase [Defluviitaleaceae bacterium]MCL2238993.1 sugar phosphate isomerase/epimerase [Defluviitaleaceae bacterium]
MSLPVALQLYSVRDEFAADLRGTLQQVKEMGYVGVELAGFGNYSPMEVKNALTEADLHCISAHVPYDVIAADPAKVLADYKSVGCAYIVIPWLDMERAPGGEDFEGMIPEIEAMGKQAKESGLTLLYHNHDFEFRKIGDKYGLDVLYERVPADLLQTQIDTCWIKFVGIDPADYLRKYKNRAPLVHIKDFTMGENFTGVPYGLIGADTETKKEAMSGFTFKAVGSGIQDVPAILQASLDVAAQWVIVEFDASPERPPLETARMSRDYLRKLGW